MDDVAALIGHAGLVPRAIVGVGSCRRVGISNLGKALSGVVLRLGGMAVGVGACNLVAGIVIGVGEVSLDAGDL